MLVIAGLVMSSALVLGFYGYVFWQLYREHRRMRNIDKRLREHLIAQDTNAEPGPDSRRRAYSRLRQENLIQVGVAVCGLLGVFAEIGLLNRLFVSLH
jgi:hypothetical protein